MFTNLWRAIILAMVLNACAEAPPQIERPTESKFLPGSVVLYVTRATGEFLCSGVLVDATTVATAKHCTDDAERIVVYEPVSRRMSLTGKVVEDPVQDRAELHTVTAFDTHAAIASVVDARPVRVQGFGCSDGARLEQRNAVFYGTGDDHPRQIVWAGKACRGDSGGGIWTADGRLAAVMTETGFIYDRGRRINIVVGELL